MVKRSRPFIVFAITLILAVSLKNEFFTFLLGFEALVFAASVAQTVYLSRRLSVRAVLPERIVFRGEPFQIRLELTNQSRLPVPQLMARAAVRVFPEKEELLLRGKLMLGSRETGSLCFQMDSAHCGCLEVRPNQLMITDFLGLVQRKCRVDVEDRHLLFVLPEALKDGAELPEGANAVIDREGEQEKKGTTAIDVAEIRPYALGDLMKLIHWKLSARLSELMVRDMQDPAEELLRVYLDLREQEDKKNTRLDKDAWDHFSETVAVASGTLLAHEQPHVVCWADAAANAMVKHTVQDEESQQRMLCELMRAQTFHAKDYLPLFKEVDLDEAQETILTIDLQGRIDRSAGT